MSRPNTRRLLGGVAARAEGVLLAWCIASLVVSGAALRATAARPTETAHDAAAAAIEALQTEFATDATSLGLALLGEPVTSVLRVAPNGDELVAVSLTASVPPAERRSAVFYWRRTVFAVAGVTGTLHETAHNDTTVAFDGASVTVEVADSFASDSGSELAGKQIRRIARFQVDGLDDLLSLAAPAGAGASGSDLSPPPATPAPFSARTAQDRGYRETVTVVDADGTTTTYPAEQFRLGEALGQGGAAGIGCVTQCFSDHGGEIGFAGAACLVGGAVVCAAACAASAGVACLPCIASAGTLCGLAVGTGALAACVATCLFGYTPPTATPRPRPTATPTPDTRTYTLSARPSVHPGQPIELFWTAPAGHSTRDWVGLFYAGGDNHDYIRFEYLTAGSSGTASITAPDLPGAYESRVLLNDGYVEPATPARVSIDVREAYAGDCDGDGRVAVNELVLGVRIALGNVPASACPAFDLDGDGSVAIGELIAAVNEALST
jgi:hypothetical protein